MQNDLLLHIFCKKLIKSRDGTTESIRHLGGVLLPNTYFRTTWIGGLRTLLILVVREPSDLHSRTVRIYSGISGLSARAVRRTQDR